MLVPSRRTSFLGALVLILVSISGIPPFAQFIPRPPRDVRAQEAKVAFDAGRYHDAVRIYQNYLKDHPQQPEAWLFLGWSFYRTGDFENAAASFDRSLSVEPDSLDASIGLGYATLQKGSPEQAARIFIEAIERDPKRGDALTGLILAGRRPDAPEWVMQQSAVAAQKLEILEGGDAETLLSSAMLVPGREKRLRAPVQNESAPAVKFRSGTGYIEQRTTDGWKPLFIKGINLGAALPGRFPAEFPSEEETYREWLDMMGGFGLNAVRLYTLFPPAFYRALDDHNTTPGSRKIWLIQGVWAELPEDHLFSGTDYEEGFKSEAKRVVDAVHGNLALGPVHGGAWGLFDRDVSSHVLGYIIGREWEPFAVRDFNDARSGDTNWVGEWFEVNNGRAMEIWLARMCEFVVAHEASNYGQVHPLSFVNWPTLDPLHHPTEATHAEENEWRRRKGLEPDVVPREWWEEDVVTLDPSTIGGTERNPAGFFASYHIYPYYPDFIQREYGDAFDQSGLNRYAGYLRHLKEHHGDQPIFVAEFGVPSSRGVAHVQPEDLHHGGHGEREMARINSKLTTTIYEEGYAGGAIFEFIDEWFKVSWSVAELEVPAERRRTWYNAENPEQAFGLVAARPASSSIVIDGRKEDWRSIPVYESD